MDRFGTVRNAAKRSKLNVNTICRCCGLQGDEMYPILDQVSDDGVEFHEKVSTLMGKKNKANAGE